MKKNKDNLVDKCCNLLGLKLSEFCKRYNLKESTMKDWRRKLPSYGKVMLEQIMENYKLKKELEIKVDKLSKLQSLINEK